MKTSSARAMSTAQGKRGKPRAKANASMENLFGMEEEEIARLFSEETARSKERSSSKTSSTTSVIDPISLRDNALESPKRKSAKAKSSGSKETSSNSIKSTRTNVSSLFPSQEDMSKNSPLQSLSKEELINQLENLPFVTTANQIDPDLAESEDYAFEMTNEEIDGVSKQMSAELSKDLSFEAEDEFFVELSDLEFGPDYPLEENQKDNNETTYDSCEPQISDIQKEDNESELLGEDETFELPDNYSSKSSEKQVQEKVPSFMKKSTQNDNGQEMDPSVIETIEDDKFDMDELINAGTNSYSPKSKSYGYQIVNQDNDLDDLDEFEGVKTEDFTKDITEEKCNINEANASPVQYVPQSYTNYLSFEKADVLQEILQAWAFGDTVALIQLGQETSLEDDPFYSGDDDNFGYRHNSFKTQQATKVDVIEHPLARYGLKVRTLNAIELVGEENYYSLSEDSRRELEILVQDLSKTEEGTVRNEQLKQAISGLFS